MTETITYIGSKGSIAGFLQLPQGKNDKLTIAIILHGIGDHKDTPFMNAVNNELLTNGIGTLRIDFNGHGDSAGSFTDMTIPLEIEDARQAVNYVSSLPYVDKIVLIGHSQGGVVAGMLAGKLGKDAINGLVLLAPAAVLKDGALEGNILGGTFNTDDVPDTLPIVWGVLGKNYITTTQKLDIYGETRKYLGPTYIIHGTNDTVVPVHYAERYHKELPHSELSLLNGYGHSFDPNGAKVGELASNFILQIH